MTMTKVAVVLALCAALASADMYLHNMRGSNNRLDERNRDRDNGNRLFDSQNNNRGGSNVGSLYFYEGEHVPLEWTNQHGCGNEYNHCEIVIQYMCDDRLRDGVTTRTIPDQPSECLNLDCNNDVRYGMHEDYDYYMNCKYRFRNRGLFTADRNLNGNTARFTRQNENGNRRGYECPEERDHYPYWHPSPWIDLAIFTNDAGMCEFYQNQSENVKGRMFCSLPDDWYHDMVRRGGNGNNGFIPNTQALCQGLNAPNSPMKQFLQAKAAALFARISAAAKEEFDECEKAQSACALVAQDAELHAACNARFQSRIVTETALNGNATYCPDAEGLAQHPVSKCPVCVSKAACGAGAWVERNSSIETNQGCPSDLFMVEQQDSQWCVLKTCNATHAPATLANLEAYDAARARFVAGKYLVNAAGECRSRLPVSADCVARLVPDAVWTMSEPHNARLPWLQPPVCRENQWSRANHLGNGIGGFTNGHNLSMPQHFHESCALRIRYNITTGRGDYNGRDPHDAGQVNASLNRLNNQGPARIRVNEEHNIPTTNSDRPWENARGYEFEQNPQVQIFDTQVMVQYCADKRAVVPNDPSKCFVLGAGGVPTAAKTAAKAVYCPMQFALGVAYTGNASNENGECAASCVGATGTVARLFCPSQAAAQEKDFVLQLAINTNQFGRTFQDRTHSYAVRERPQELKDRCDAIYALNVRGKRGNIVQTYPGVEYDFTPDRLHVAEGDCIHFQWTGSNTNPNNNDGQGKQGTDRHNIALQEKVRGEGGRGVERAGGKGRNGNTWTTANMEPGWEFFQLNAAPTMADRSCEWRRTSAGQRLFSFTHPLDWQMCVSCAPGNWTKRPATVAADGTETLGPCPAGTEVDFASFGVSLRHCVNVSACVPGSGSAFRARPMHRANWTSGLDNHDPGFKGFPSSQVGVPDALARGHWGMSHPDHLDNVTRAGFIGLTREQLVSLATLDLVQFRGEMSELDDAGTYFDMPVHKVSGLGTYYYMCTRNNNFSNRSQKGKIVVEPAPEVTNLIGSPGGMLTMQTEGSFVRQPASEAERLALADFAVVVPPKSLSAAVPIEIKVMPSSAGKGMPAAASDVLWVGPASLSASKVFPDATARAAPAGGRRAAGDELTVSFRVVDASSVWFRIRGAALAAVAAANPARNVIEFSLSFMRNGQGFVGPVRVELNNANELEGRWIGLSAETVRAIEAGDVWVAVSSPAPDNFFGAGAAPFLAKLETVPNTGTPITIRMPVSVTLEYGRVYRFEEKTCIENYQPGCEFAREVVSNAQVSNGQAVFARGGSVTQPAGGYYQVSAGNNLPLIVGVTVACVVVAFVFVGAAVYFRRHPAEWTSFREYGPKKYREFQRSFASQV